jgi:hypothetical protein
LFGVEDVERVVEIPSDNEVLFGSREDIRSLEDLDVGRVESDRKVMPEIAISLEAEDLREFHSRVQRSVHIRKPVCREGEVRVVGLDVGSIQEAVGRWAKPRGSGHSGGESSPGGKGAPIHLHVSMKSRRKTMTQDDRIAMRKRLYKLIRNRRKNGPQKQPGILLGQMFEFGPKSVYRSTSELAPESNKSTLLEDMNELQQFQDGKGNLKGETGDWTDRGTHQTKSAEMGGHVAEPNHFLLEVRLYLPASTPLPCNTREVCVNFTIAFIVTFLICLASASG